MRFASKSCACAMRTCACNVSSTSLAAMPVLRRWRASSLAWSSPATRRSRSSGRPGLRRLPPHRALPRLHPRRSPCQSDRPGSSSSMVSSDADPVGRILEASGLVLERARLLGSRRPIVVAVSGGADSLCLLDAMMTLLAHAKRRIVVGHVDHCLRPESKRDAEHVREAADRYGVRCEVATVDVPALAASERRGIEEAARV